MNTNRCFSLALVLALLTGSLAYAKNDKLAVPQPYATTTMTDQVLLKWNASEGAVSYKIRRGTTATFSQSKSIGTSTKISYSDTTAVAGTTYYYWVLPVNQNGVAYYNSGKYAVGKRATETVKLEVPTPYATTDRTDSVGLSWKSISGAKSYRIYRGTTTTLSAASVLTTTSSTSYSDITAVAETTYYYWVCPIDVDGRQWTDAPKYAAGRRLQATVSAALTPPQPTATTSYTSYILVVWSKVPNAVQYRVRRGTSSNYSKSTQIAVVDDRTCYYDTTATPGVTYYYWINPVNAAGQGWYNSSRYSTGKRASSSAGKLTPPQPTATTVSTNYIYVSWPEVSGAVSYRIRRGTSKDYAKSTQIAQVVAPGTSYHDYTATPGVTYYYWVNPENANGDAWYNKGKYAKGLRVKK